MNIKELYWAAGFMEGEGSFTAVHAGKRSDGSPRQSFNLMVSAGQVDLWPLERLQKLFGGSTYRHNMHTGNPCHRWQLCGKRGAALMMTLWTIMSDRRREQINRALERWKLNRSYVEAALRGDAWKEARRAR